MTDLFAQQGINFMSSSMASTHPTATPEPIEAPKVDIGNAPANATPATPAGTQPAQNSGDVPQQAAPEQGAATAGAAPPQPPAPSSNVDLFEQQGIKAPSVSDINADAFNQGVIIPPRDPNAAPAPIAEVGGFDKDGKPEVNPVAYAQNQQSKDEQLGHLLFTPAELDSFKNNKIGWAEGAGKVNAYGYALGDNDANAVKLAPIGYKVLNNESLTPDETNELVQWARDRTEINLRGFSWGGRTAYTGLQMPSWVAQFLLSGGVGKLAEAGAERVGVVAAEKTMEGAAVRILTQGSTLMAAHYTAARAEQQLNDISAITDKGQLVLRDSENSPAKTALLAFGHTAADVIPQMLTPAIGKFIVKPIQGAIGSALATPITAAAKSLPPAVTNALYGAWKAVQPNATVSKMFTSAGWNGMVEQLGANRIQQVMNATLDVAGNKHETFDQYMDSLTPSKDQLMVEAGLFSIAGGIHASTNIAVHLLGEKGVPVPEAQEAVANMSSLEKDAYVQQNLKLPESDTPTLANPDVSPDAAQVPEVHADAPQGVDTAKNIVAGATREANAASPALIRDENSGFNVKFKAAKLYAEMENDLQPIENFGKIARAGGAPIGAAELSPGELSLAKSTPPLIEEQWTTRTTTWDKEGNKITTGKGLKQIGDDFDNLAYKIEPNRDARQKDINDFRKALTFIEDKTKGYSPVSDKDFNESQATVSRIADKYGEQTKWLENTAKEYRDWDNRILHNLVTSGLKTQAWYDDLVGKREWYSSTARVIESEYPDDTAVMKSKGLGADVNPKNIGALKQRKGSTLEVQDPVISSMRNSAIIMKRAALNQVRRNVAKFAEYYPEQVKVKPPAIIREAVDHSYDPKLRTKLEQLTEFLGGEVKRVQQGEKVGDKKSNLGAYEPAKKAIWMRAGSTEGTLTHEAGHMLDYVLGLKEHLLRDPEMKAELEKLSEDRLRSEIKLQQTPEGKTEFAEKFEQNPKKYVDYVKNPREVLANFFDAYVNSPKQAKEVAPKTVAAFEKLIDANPQLAMLKDIAPSTQRATETIQRELLDFKGPKDSLPFYDNGKLKFLHMDEETAKAFQGLDEVSRTMTGNFFKKVGKAQARLEQFGATNNPYFIARHFLRGAASSYVNTPLNEGASGFFRHFAIEIPKGIAAVIGKTDAYRDWAGSSGALRTFMDTSTEGMAKAHKELFESMDMSKFLDPRNWAAIAKDGALKGWQTAKQVSDYAPRIASYNRLIDAGYTPLEAGFLSLEATGNYTRHGSVGKIINAYSPFFNDRLQGADRFIRAVKRDPAGYSLRAVALITMPQILVTGYYLYAADEQTRQEYLNLSDFRRGAAMNIKIGGRWIPFPRAFAPGYVFGALPEQAMIHFSGIAHPELKNFWLHLLGDTVNSLSPSTDWTQTIPPMIKAAIEHVANFSFYRNQPIFHGDRNKTAPENQYNAATSESAKALGKMFGISPADIDNTAYDMAAHVGVYAQQLGDYAINTAKRLQGQPVNEKPTKGSDNPLYGPLMQPAPVGTASESFQEFHEHETDLAQQHNRDKEMEGKDKADFEQANHQDLALYPTVARANTEVMHEEHEIRLITENPHFTGDEKAQQIAQHQQRIEAIVEGANRTYRAVKEQK